MERRKLSWWRGKARVVFRVGIVIGFVVHSFLLLMMYLEYPSMVQLDVEQPNEVDFPAFTICNLNEVRITPYCEKYPSHCGSIETNPELCTSYPEYCHLVGNKIKKMPLRRVEKYELSRYEAQTFGHQEKDLLVRCTVEIDGNETFCKRNLMLISTLSHSNMRPFNCFMYNSLYGRPNDKPDRVPVSTVIRLHLNPEVSEYHPQHLSRGAQISVHSPYHVPSPMSEGQLLNSGTLYRLYIRETRMNFLPAPYKSNCRNYKKEWFEAGGKGPITQRMCKEKCKLDKSMELYGCADTRIDFPHNFSLCDKEIPPFHQQSCSESCSLPCQFSRFEVQTQVAKIGGNWKSCTTAKDLTCAILVHLFLENMEITSFDYNPRFDAEGVLGWIGGYMGLWLGISLLHMYDFLEKNAFRLMTYMRKKKSRRKGRRSTRPSYESNISGAIYHSSVNHRF